MKLTRMQHSCYAVVFCTLICSMLLTSCATSNAPVNSFRYMTPEQAPTSFELKYVPDPQMSKENLSEKYYEAYESLGYFEIERLLQDSGIPYLQRNGFNNTATTSASKNLLEFQFQSTNFSMLPGKSATPVMAYATLYDATGKQKIWSGEYRLNLGGDYFWGSMNIQRVNKRLIENLLFLMLKQMKTDGIIRNQELIAPA